MCRGIRAHATGTEMVKLEESRDEAEQVGRGQLGKECVWASLEGEALISLWSGDNRNGK